MNKFTLTLACCLLIFFANSSLAKEWQGIFPLSSTREDVKRLLGEPVEDFSPASALYRFNEDLVYIEYTVKPCDGIQPPWKPYRLSGDWVLTVTVGFAYFPLVSDYRIPNIDKLKKVGPDETGFLHYFNEEQGVAYGVKDGKLRQVTYGPSAADSHLRCSENEIKDDETAQPNNSFNASVNKGIFMREAMLFSRLIAPR